MPANCILCLILPLELRHQQSPCLTPSPRAVNTICGIFCSSCDCTGTSLCFLQVATSGLDVYAHNIETVERLQRRVRDHRAGYVQSLGVLEAAKAAAGGGRRAPLITKTSIMLGLGEAPAEVEATLRNLRSAGCDVVTLGQYLRPSKRHLPVREYISPAAFTEWQRVAEAMGFRYVASGPLVRSSYRAGEFFLKALLEGRRQAATAHGGEATAAAAEAATGTTQAAHAVAA
ncbi:unnamed protein product [Phaeothamnion confervicola]